MDKSVQDKSTDTIGAKKADEVKQKLELSITDIVDLKAFIWATGKNADGELGLGNEEKVSLPKNVA